MTARTVHIARKKHTPQDEDFVCERHLINAGYATLQDEDVTCESHISCMQGTQLVGVSLFLDSEEGKWLLA